MPSITKSYEPRDVEKKWYAAWRQAGCFAGRAMTAMRASRALQHRDSAAERHRRADDGPRVEQHAAGYPDPPRAARRAQSALWLPGPIMRASPPRPWSSASCARRRKRATISAGKSSSRRSGTGARKRAASFCEQLRRLGASCDWDRTQFTMDPALLARGADRVRGSFSKGTHLSRQAHGELVPGVADGALGRGSDHEAGQRHDLPGALRAGRSAGRISSRWQPPGPRRFPATWPSRCIRRIRATRR